MTIVSSLDVGDEGRLIIKPKKNADELQKYFYDNRDWITWHKELNNEKILKLCKKAHVGLLPTSSDTYGYSVLEMQAGGTPVVTTDIMALPEINNEKCGWLVNLERRNDKNEILDDDEFREYSKEILYKELEPCLKQIIQKPESIEKKAIAAYRRIREYHSVVNYRKRLLELYQR